MTDALKPVTEILVPIDFSQCSLHALDFAKRIAAASDGRLHLLYVDDDPVLIDQSTDQSFRDEHENKMSMKFIELMSQQERDRFQTVMAIRLGTAYHVIEEYAKEKGIELIVMGNVGHSPLTDVLVGSVTSHVIRHAPCPVLSVRQTQ